MDNNETWLIDTGDLVITRKADIGYEQLSAIEKAVYCFWVLDYAVRNSGTLEPVQEIRPTAIAELRRFSDDNSCVYLGDLLDKLTNRDKLNEDELFDTYSLMFDQACNDIRMLWRSHFE